MSFVQEQLKSEILKIFNKKAETEFKHINFQNRPDILKFTSEISKHTQKKKIINFGCPKIGAEFKDLPPNPT